MMIGQLDWEKIDLIRAPKHLAAVLERLTLLSFLKSYNLPVFISYISKFDSYFSPYVVIPFLPLLRALP